jgi:hypothetical protein
MGEARRHNSEKINNLFEALPRKHELKEKDEHVDENQRTRNDRHGPAWNGVLNWKHLGSYLSRQRDQSAATGASKFIAMSG